MLRRKCIILVNSVRVKVVLRFRAPPQDGMILNHLIELSAIVEKLLLDEWLNLSMVDSGDI